MLPTVVTDAAIASEILGLKAWLTRHKSIVSDSCIDERIIRVTFVQEGTGEKILSSG